MCGHSPPLAVNGPAPCGVPSAPAAVGVFAAGAASASAPAPADAPPGAAEPFRADGVGFRLLRTEGATGRGEGCVRLRDIACGDLAWGARPAGGPGKARTDSDRLGSTRNVSDRLGPTRTDSDRLGTTRNDSECLGPAQTAPPERVRGQARSAFAGDPKRRRPVRAGPG